MLGRTAHSLFWMSRYIERAENMARLARCRLPHRADARHRRRPPRGMEFDAGERRASTRQFAEKHGDAAVERGASTSCCATRTTRRRVRSCLRDARTNARMVRTALTREMWESDQRGLARLRRDRAAARSRPRDLPELLDWISQRDGAASAARCSARCCATTAIDFSQLGTFVERADNTARILDVKYYVLLPSQPAGRRRGRQLAVGVDPALGLGAPRLPLCLSRALPGPGTSPTS